MPLTATATKGLERKGTVQPNEVLLVPADPSDAISEGGQLTFTATEGVADICAADEPCYARAHEKKTMEASTVGFTAPASVDVAAGTYAGLVHVQSIVPAGTPIFECTFSDHYDDTIAAAGDNTVAAPYVGLTTGCGADDRPNGALVYVYEGTGVGQVNVVADYDHADGNADKELIFHRAFSTALDTTSKIIILSGETATTGSVGFFGRVTTKSQLVLDVSDGGNNGSWVVYLDWRQAADYLKNLKLPVVAAGSILMA